jgi:dipeptidyl aminopeptidase/acylaminoacyl peptidase
MNADDGSGQTRLTNNDADDFNPSWSPDGEKIAFSGSRDNNEESGSNFDIFVMNADDGSGQTRLTNNDADDSDLDWGTNTSSPDGDGNGSSTTTSQQASDEVISANTDHNTNDNTDDNNHDILGFLIAVVQCFTDNDEEFSDDVQLCLYGVIDDYFDNVDNNLNNDNDGRDYNNNNNNNDISSNDNNNNGTSSQET